MSFSRSTMFRKAVLIICCGCAFVVIQECANAQVTPERILGYKPLQQDVDIDIPAAADVPKCKLDVEREGKSTGYLLTDPQGLVLRRFMDSDADDKIDQFQYFKQGLEVYRDNDTNGDEKIDQCRWLNTGGTRWGIDKDQDGKIDSWRMISAEEASREAIRALVSGDEQGLRNVLITVPEMQQLGLSSEIVEKLSESVGDVRGKMVQAMKGSKVLTSQTKWLRFDTSMLMPNLIPGGGGKSSKDLLVYENVMAIVDIAGESGFVQVGEMVRVGDVWKLTQIPRPVEGEQFVADGGILLQPSATGMAAGATAGLTPEVEALLKDLRELDMKAQAAQGSAETLTKYNEERAGLLAKLANAVTTAEDKDLWTRQLLEHISAATQMAAYPNGAKVLLAYEAQLRKSKADMELVAFATWQRMLAEYNTELQAAAQADRAKVQEKWFKSLEDYVKEFPKAQNASDALLQIALTHELNGNLRDAEKWYTRVVSEYTNSDPAKRAAGALRRFKLRGEKLVLAGNAIGGGNLDLAQYKGKAVLVLFWTTWCQPCIADLPTIQELYKTHRAAGFEVVGVCLDDPGPQIEKYLKDYNVTWPSILENGGLHSRPAVEFGVVTLPTMILTDKTGTVVLSNATLEDLKKQVPVIVKNNVSLQRQSPMIDSAW